MTDRCSFFRCGLALLLALALLTSGCRPSPRAPALEDNAVYQSSREGFRFLVPEGWVQQAKTDVPPGPATQERLLVLYRTFESDPPASLEVSLIDLPEEANLTELLATPSAGVKWQPKGPPQVVKVGGASAKRYDLDGTVGQQKLAREVFVFRRGQRCYLFSIRFGATDRARQEQARQAIQSLSWSR